MVPGVYVGSIEMRKRRDNREVAICRATAAMPPCDEGFGETIHTRGERTATSASTCSSRSHCTAPEPAFAPAAGGLIPFPITSMRWRRRSARKGSRLASCSRSASR